MRKLLIKGLWVCLAMSQGITLCMALIIIFLTYVHDQHVPDSIYYLTAFMGLLTWIAGMILVLQFFGVKILEVEKDRLSIKTILFGFQLKDKSYRLADYGYFHIVRHGEANSQNTSMVFSSTPGTRTQEAPCWDLNGITHAGKAVEIISSRLDDESILSLCNYLKGLRSGK